MGVRVALFTAYFVFAILLNSVGTVILQSISSFGVSKEGASILEAFKDLPIAVVSFFVASLLPRLGYRKAMIIGFALVALASIAMPLAPGFGTTKLLFFAVGASFALIKVSVYSTIGLLTENSNQHASLLNMIEGVFMVGVLTQYIVFSTFIDSANPSSLDWLNVYWLLAVLCIANIILLASIEYPKAVVIDEMQTIVSDFKDMASLIWKPIVLIFLGSAFLFVLIEQAIGTWLPTFNNEVLHMPQAMSVQVAGIFAASAAIGRFGAGVLLKKIDWYWLLNFCVIAMAVLIVLALPLASGLSPDPDMTWFSAPIAAYVIPLIGLFLAPIYPAINSVILSALPKGYHAAMAGLIVVFSALGGTTGSLVTGQIFGAFDGVTAFYFSLVPITGLLIVLFFFRRIHARQRG